MWDVLWTQKTTQTRQKQWIFSFFLSPQHPQPAYMPASGLFFSGILTCIFAFIPGDHQGSVGTSGGQKKAKNGAKLHVLGWIHLITQSHGVHLVPVVTSWRSNVMPSNSERKWSRRRCLSHTTGPKNNKNTPTAVDFSFFWITTVHKTSWYACY